MAYKAPARKKETFTPGHPTDIKIGICRGLGLSREDTAIMAGCSVPTVDIRKLEPVAKEWEEWAAKAAAAFKIETKEHFEQQIRRRVGKAMDVIDRAVQDGDVKTALMGADRILDRAYGKATQKVETTSDVTERHVFELPEATLETLRAVAASLQPRRIEGETIIDVTPIEDDGDTPAG